MWLNTIILGLACLFTGFIVGWVCGRPRRWDRYVWAETSGAPWAETSGAPGTSAIPETSGPDDLPPLPGGVTTGDQTGE
jgi:hypothetical protein